MFNSQRYVYPSRRIAAYGSKGMVCASQAQAAQAGLDMLKRGGNAADAIIATAAALLVLEPMSNSLGGDAFALAWMDGKLHGLNASGPSPMLISADQVRASGHEKMPESGWLPVTVPGMVSGWKMLNERFGRMPLEELLAPALTYASEGFPVGQTTAIKWRSLSRFEPHQQRESTRALLDVFAPSGRIPKAGELFRNGELAAALDALAKSGGEALYRGELAEKIARCSEREEGYLRYEDLARYSAEWVEPISINYRGYDIWELPPNGHGLVALMALGILRGFDFGDRDAPDTYHKQFEATKLAFADGQTYITDPAFMKASVGALLSERYLASRRAQVGDRAAAPTAGKPESGGTVYLCAADGEGNMISYIQSCFQGFGAGVMVPGTGVVMQNRGRTFSLDPGHDNFLLPGKRTYHTIIPGFLTQNGAPVGPFGVMGGYMQPQGHLQVIMNSIDFDLNPQQALDAPRWMWKGGMDFDVEPGFPMHVAADLTARGHNITVADGSMGFGLGQIIWRDGQGVLMGATDPRVEGAVAAW